MENLEKGNRSDESAKLQSIAEMFMGRDCVGKLLDWYEDIMNGDYQLVVFVVRRCYLLALILAKISGMSNGHFHRDEETTGKVFLTDAASCLQCRKMADYYRQKRSFPRILFVDDILIHGRNLNRLIFDMESRLYFELGDEFEEEDIRAAFVRAMEIKVFVRARGNLLLREIYERKLHYELSQEAKEWRELSSNISLLILNADVSNASYIFTEHLSENEFQQLQSEPEFGKFEESVYQGTKQYTSVEFLRWGDTVKAAYVVRILDNNFMDGYRVLPFVFLPKMNMTVENELIELIKTKIPCSGWFDMLYDLDGQRSCRELLTLILSHILLQDFNYKFMIKRNVEISEDWKEELLKLVRNYNSEMESYVTVKNNLRSIISSSLFNKCDMSEYLLNIMPEECFLVETDGRGMALGIKEKKEWFYREEDHFWNRGYEAEMMAHEYTGKLYLSGRKRGQQPMVTVEDELRYLFKYPTQEQLRVGIICFLQMMDAGIVGVTSNAPIDKVDFGYAQYVKYGEQALLHATIELYEYIPVLVMIQQKCNLMKTDIKQELVLFEQSGLLEQEELEFDRDRIMEYLDKLETMGQHVRDWSGNFYRRKALAEPGETKFTMRWLINFQDLQNRYVKAYFEFLNQKY